MEATARKQDSSAPEMARRTAKILPMRLPKHLLSLTQQGAPKMSSWQFRKP